MDFQKTFYKCYSLWYESIMCEKVWQNKGKKEIKCSEIFYRIRENYIGGKWKWLNEWTSFAMQEIIQLLVES